jgi:hypothetical protein
VARSIDPVTAFVTAQTAAGAVLSHRTVIAVAQCAAGAYQTISTGYPRIFFPAR